MIAGHEVALREVIKRIDKRSHQFQKKGNEAQFVFNTTVEEHVETARKELLKVMPAVTEKQQLAIIKAVTELDKGSKAIATSQKHIRIANCSELGWSVVTAYESNELADNPDGIKSRLTIVSREAKKKQPYATNE